jgi:hypothetical protein
MSDQDKTYVGIIEPFQTTPIQWKELNEFKSIVKEMKPKISWSALKRPDGNIDLLVNNEGDEFRICVHGWFYNQCEVGELEEIIIDFCR